MRNPFEQLRRIQEAIIKIMQFAKKGQRRFDREESIRLSIINYLLTIGEVAYAISQDFKNRHPEVPWEQMVSFRNLLANYYIEIEQDVLWNIVEHDLPNLKSKIDAVLEQMDRRDTNSKNLDIKVGGKKTAGALERLLQAKREDILRAAGKYGASNVRIFGSVVRGEADAESDIDLLVDMEPGRTLFDLSELLMDLQDLLGRDVDIVTEKGLHDRIRERVLKEAIPL